MKLNKKAEAKIPTPAQFKAGVWVLGAFALIYFFSVLKFDTNARYIFVAIVGFLVLRKLGLMK